jgi:3-hydroxy-3-methylglutaryl CoA synthase
MIFLDRDTTFELQIQVKKESNISFIKYKQVHNLHNKQDVTHP